MCSTSFLPSTFCRFAASTLFVFHCQPSFVTLSVGRMCAAGSRWQFKQKLMLNDLSWRTSSIWSMRPWHSTQLMPRVTWTEWLKSGHCSTHCRGRFADADRLSKPDCDNSCTSKRRADSRTMIFPHRCGRSGSPHQVARRESCAKTAPAARADNRRGYI